MTFVTSNNLNQQIVDPKVDSCSPTAIALLSERAYSDSALVLPTCRMSPDKHDKHDQLLHHASTAVKSPRLPGNRPTTEATTLASPPPRDKPKHNLNLGSFQSLGIANPTPHPTALLTPPDESSLPIPAQGADVTESHPRQHSFTGATMPKAPDLAESDTTTGLPNDLGEDATPRQDGHVKGKAPEIPEVEISTPHAPAMSWVFGPVHIIVTATTQNPSQQVFGLLCHSQPCPLPSEDLPTTAFAELMTQLQYRIPSDAYIEVTHAVPRSSSMNQVPTSPAVTPNPRTSQAPDYFSVQNTFSKAVIATSYQDALESSVPSSPHPLVAPSTIRVSLLERFIPPNSANEIQDLFTNEAPSELVNRLTELSTDGGTLLFIYPTKVGATTFKNNYLGPLLNPHLRTMAGVHGLMSDLGTNIARLEAIDHIPTFDNMVKKVKQLLSKLARSTNPGRPPRRFDVLHQGTEMVPLDRKSWQTWYIHQEKARIQGIVKRYFQRGQRLPVTPGISAGAIYREIIEGLERREYDAHCPTQDGIEVGVFVIQRTR